MTTLREALNKPGCERIKDYYSVGPIQKAAVEQFLDEYMALAIKETVNKFLGWKLPLDFYPDNGISFDKKYVEKWGMPTGTNLLTADQATEMFKHCLSVTTQPETQANQPLAAEQRGDIEKDLIIIGLKALSHHVRLVPAYANLVGDMDTVDIAVRKLKAAPQPASVPI